MCDLIVILLALPMPLRCPLSLRGSPRRPEVSTIFKLVCVLLAGLGVGGLGVSLSTTFTLLFVSKMPPQFDMGGVQCTAPSALINAHTITTDEQFMMPWKLFLNRTCVD